MFMSKFCNNTLYIESNRKIKKDDLELIILYFESTKLSGGYDILKHELIEPNIIEINYKYNESKQEILRRNQFKYDKYELRVLDFTPKSFNEPKKINNLLIFSNIDVQSNEMLELYIDFLIQGEETSNSIDKIVKSILFQQSYYVYFKNDVNYEFIGKRLQKKPKLRDKEVKIYEAFELNNLIFGLNSLIESDLNKFEEKYDIWFSKKEDKIYWNLPFKEKSPFISVFFKKYSQVKKLRTKNFLVPNYGYLVCENCFNFEFFDNYYKKIFEDRLTHTEIKSIANKDSINNEETSSDIKSEPLKSTTPSITNQSDEPIKRKTYKEFEEELPLAKLAKLEADEFENDDNSSKNEEEQNQEVKRERKLSTDSFKLNRGRREAIIMGIKWCPYCKVKFSTKKDMQDHKRSSDHKEEKRSAYRDNRLCALCNQVFKTIDLRDKHMESYTHKVYASEYEKYLIENPEGSEKIWKKFKSTEAKETLVSNVKENPVKKVFSNDKEIQLTNEKKPSKSKNILGNSNI